LMAEVPNEDDCGKGGSFVGGPHVKKASWSQSSAVGGRRGTGNLGTGGQKGTRRRERGWKKKKKRVIVGGKGKERIKRKRFKDASTAMNDPQRGGEEFQKKKKKPPRRGGGKGKMYWGGKARGWGAQTLGPGPQSEGKDSWPLPTSWGWNFPRGEMFGGRGRKRPLKRGNPFQEEEGTRGM